MELVILVPIFLITYLVFLLLRSLLIILGYVMVPIAVSLKAYDYRESRIYKDRKILAFTHDIFWLWGNEEEGIGWYGDYDSISKKILYSEIIRNPVNNLRYVPFLSLKINPEKVKFYGSLGSYKDNLDRSTVEKYDSDNELFWSITWQGLYSNIRVHFNLLDSNYRFWLGWKIYPEDIYGLPDWDHRKATAGFSTQLKRI